ncbi:MAG TPA: twin-arginine translocase TatA/TatE family subunit [Oligoflexia bacterium]|nr:twin-arginine translocase TatA/TatE family subunit [Oligoflexia bacterium]HMR25324.1 twin-arginine translocase TatA/TatE family subunit [Oligoflexia bacterium]
MFGMTELLVVLGVVLLLFGGRKIPELFEGLGKGIQSFKKSMKEEDNDDQERLKNSDEPKS